MEHLIFQLFMTIIKWWRIDLDKHYVQVNHVFHGHSATFHRNKLGALYKALKSLMSFSRPYRRQFLNTRTTWWTSANSTVHHTHTGYRTSWTYSRGLCPSSVRRSRRCSWTCWTYAPTTSSYPMEMTARKKVSTSFPRLPISRQYSLLPQLLSGDFTMVRLNQRFPRHL